MARKILGLLVVLAAALAAFKAARSPKKIEQPVLNRPASTAIEPKTRPAPALKASSSTPVTRHAAPLKPSPLASVEPNAEPPSAQLAEELGLITRYHSMFTHFGSEAVRREVFAQIYADPSLHRALLESFSNFDLLSQRYASRQAEARVFIAAYLDFLAVEQGEIDVALAVLNRISAEIAQVGDRKHRSLDLEDLVMSYVAAIDKAKFLDSPADYLQPIHVNRATHKIIKLAIAAAIPEVGENPARFKQVSEILEEQI